MKLLGTDTMERECINRKSMSYLLLDKDANLTAGNKSGTRANMKSN